MIYHRFCSEVNLLANKENCKISKANLTILSGVVFPTTRGLLLWHLEKLKKKTSAGAEEGVHTPPPPEMTYYGILIQLVLCQTMNSQWLEICNSMAAYHARKYGI